MSTLRTTMTASAALLLFASAADAQTRRRESVPVDQLPPAGMCRVWIDGVAANRQPAATDCNTARANAPANSRIIYGNSSNGHILVDPRRGDSRYDPRYDPRNNRDQRELTKEQRKRLKEREKEQRKRQKEWEKSHRSDSRRDRDRDDDDERRARESRGADERRGRDDGRNSQVPPIFRP